MLDRTNIHFKKAVKAVLTKVNRIHNDTMSVHFNQRYMSITMFNDTGVFYDVTIGSYHSKDEILQKLDNFDKMYYAWVQLQKKGGRHE